MAFIAAPFESEPVAWLLLGIVPLAILGLATFVARADDELIERIAHALHRPMGWWTYGWLQVLVLMVIGGSVYTLGDDSPRIVAWVVGSVTCAVIITFNVALLRRLNAREDEVRRLARDAARPTG